jgi:protocatechuate 3,4-dioxygenase beta subunit
MTVRCSRYKDISRVINVAQGLLDLHCAPASSIAGCDTAIDVLWHCERRGRYCQDSADRDKDGRRELHGVMECLTSSSVVDKEEGRREQMGT